jgi:GAF domain-containing protein
MASAEATTAFRALGRMKIGEMHLRGVLASIAEIAQDTVPGAEEVSITLVNGRTAQTAGSTGELANGLDDYQYREGGGPCLDASARQSTVSAPQLPDERRWPDWAAYAVSQGVRSSLSVGLPIQEEIRGSLNVYAGREQAFTARAVALAESFAQYAAVGIGNAYLYDSTAAVASHLQTVMDSRAVVEQAKGVVIQRRHCTPDEALAVLTWHARQSHRAVEEIAAVIVAGVQDRNRS